jgi:hypothetical protein
MAVTPTLKAGMNTISTQQEFNVRGSRLYIGTLVFTSTYTTGGESLTLPFTPDLVTIPANSGYVFEYDYTNNKVKILYADYDAAADGVLIEIPNGISIAALTDVRFEAKKVGC